MNKPHNENLSINVSDSIDPGDAVGDGDPAARKVEEEMEFLKKYTNPHNMPSRIVGYDDIERMMKDAEVMVKMCSIPRGHYGEASAIAHTQIDNEDPLRFFVLNEGSLVVNPVIVNHTKQEIDKREGCMSFPGELMKDIQRYNKVEVEFQVLEENEEGELRFSNVIKENLDGHLSQVFQHECGHLNGCNIYDENYSPEKSIGLITPEDVDKDEKQYANIKGEEEA